LEDVKKKFAQFRRNYDSMSNFAHSDKAEFAKIKQMKEQYEAQIQKLTSENDRLTKENEESKTTISNLNGQVKDWKAKHDAKCKEIEKLLADLKKQEKMFENRINGINSKFDPFFLFLFRK
jgi:predicted  nucleic acid-binding Zn-ribbon protein